MKRLVSGILLGVISPLLITTPVLAHVIVTPKQVDIGEVQEFTMSVPTEKNIPTVGITLQIPAGVTEVIPNATAGWTITEQQNNTTVTAINWTGGSIPPGERDDFLFQAQAPAQAGLLKWKAYQQYQDGSVVAWVNTPTSNPESDTAPPPYSTTNVINDLTATTQPATSQNTALPLGISAVAAVLALAALSVSLSKKK